MICLIGLGTNTRGTHASILHNQPVLSHRTWQQDSAKERGVSHRAVGTVLEHAALEGGSGATVASAT